MKGKDLRNLILESYTEVLAELNEGYFGDTSDDKDSPTYADKQRANVKEAPDGVHYIRVERTEFIEALGILEKAFEDSIVKFELDDPDTIYIHNADDGDMHDAVEELQQNGIIIDETSIDDELQEMDMNDPVIMKMRAAKNRAAQAKHPDTKFAVGKQNNIERAAKIKDLERKRDQVMRDMEQEAEPEGGPIADKYGTVLNKIDQVLLKLRGTKNENYDDRNLQESLLDEVEDEEPTPEESPDTDAPKETVLEDSTDTILAKFPTVRAALVKLQTEDFKQFVTSIDWISPRPSSFRINLKNGQDYILKWTGKTFEANILGKRYFINNIADYQQALDKLAILYKESPMKGAGEEAADADGVDSADTGGGDFPGEDGGATGGDAGAPDDGGADTGGADLSGEPIDFEDGEEPEA